jgi:predicted nucleic acid-binding protein
MTVIVDSSVMVALLTDDGVRGEWARDAVDGQPLSAPHIVMPEAAHVLRRQVLRGTLSADVASLAHEDLTRMPVDLWPYAPLATRVWALRSAVSVYDATFVALAELLGAPLATLDQRLVRSPAPRCDFLTPET